MAASPAQDTESSGKKKREKKTFLAADTEIDMEFLDLDLRKFCPKKIFDIIVINEVDLESQELMSKIITTGRKYEDVSCVTFIKYSEVIALLDKFDYGILPEAVRMMVEEVLEETKHFLSVTKPDRIPQIKLAILMKIKLIEVMILHYRRELDKMEKRKILIAELDTLTRGDRKDFKTEKRKVLTAELDTLTRGDRKGDGHTLSEPSRRGKSKTHLNSWLEHLDSDSDVIFDDDIFNHVWFYAFEGFYNSKILNVLLSSKVPLTAIIRIEKKREEFYLYPPDNIFSKFWTDIDDIMYSHNRSELFENTMLMQFSIDDEDLLNVFEDLLYAIKSISEIKFQHLNYIRHINVHEVGHVSTHLPFQCMHTYKKIMSNIPLELVTEVVVLSSILEETCFQLDGYNIMDKFATLNNLSDDNSIKNCLDPRKFSLLPHGRPPKKDIPTSFQCYHRDILSKILNMYKPCGKLVYDLSMNVLKCITPFNLLELMNYQEDESVDHKHDVDPSSTQAPKENLDVFNHFINLFIFCTFEYAEQVLEPYEKEKFTENLLTYDNIAFYNNMRPKLENENLSKPSMFFDTSYNISPMDFYWREKYPSFVLMQEILNTQGNFAYVDTTYCRETERMLVQFSDWLDEFGINTRIYDETLLTPVCLRDFCRYTANEEARWIKENPPPKYVRKSEAVETCKGVTKLAKQDIYEEYRYLLETDNMGDQDLSNVSYNQIKMNQMNEVTFDEMMNELEMYPTNNNLKEEYSKQGYSKDFTAYDFGTKYFALRGARTIFVSHDNVKITVENCKFIDESDKCTVKLQYREHSLILHSSDCFRSYYSFHWILEDETIIVFEIQKRGRKQAKSTDVDFSENDVDRSHIPEVKEKPPFNLDNVKVKNIDEENIGRIFKNSLKKEFCEDRAAMDVFQGLQEAIEKKRPIYKVNKKFETIKVKKPINEVPVVTLLQRVLQDVGKKVDGGFEAEENRSKRFVPARAPNLSLTVVDSAAFRVTLPNGIYLTCYPSQVKETLVEVKQEVLSKHLTPISTEEFRLFTREGYILIKKIDGTITILMSNGNKLDFEKPDTDREDIKTSHLKPAHCKTVNDYRKKLNKLMKDSGQSDYAYYISRRGALETKRGYVINKDIIKILESSKLPYLKTSLLNFDGTKTVLEGNKISQKKLFYTVSENDFCKEEIYYERKDGFKCIFLRTASKTVEYPDGTRITSTATVANELVDGYVFITLFYKYEHPNYATVAYSEGDLLQVILNTVVIERSKDNVCTLKLDEAVTCTVDTDNVNFEKTCSKCEMSFRCNFDISPFHNNVLDYSKQFVHAEDSYLKHFFVDYGGVCRVNKNYISTSLNAANCNHMQGNIYKKLYAIKKTMSGEEFFTEGIINSYKERQEHREYVEIVKKGKYHPVLKLTYNYYQSFPDRLLTASVVNSSVTLTKYQQQTKKILYYSTVKRLCEVMNAKNVQILLHHLINKFASINNVNEKTLKLVRWLAAKKEEEANLKRAESIERQEALLREEAKYCKCVKDKKTFGRKILQWGEEYKRFKKLLREGQIPLYFDSDFCQIIKKRR